MRRCLIFTAALFAMTIARGHRCHGHRGGARSKMMKTDARLKVSANAITVFVPLSDLKIQKGQSIRLVIGVEGQLLEQTLKL